MRSGPTRLQPALSAWPSLMFKQRRLHANLRCARRAGALRNLSLAPRFGVYTDGQ